MVQVALVTLLVAVLGLVAWRLRGDRGPMYHGKALQVWLQRYVSRNPSNGGRISVGPEAEADAAVRQMGANAIPTLLHMVRAHDTKLKIALLRLASKPRFVGEDFLITAIRPALLVQQQAVVAFHALGASASNAVPVLIQTYRERIGLDSQCACAEALGCIGPAASEAIPDLICAATNSDQRLRLVAVEALGNLHADSALVVPVLTRSLQDPNRWLQLLALRSLTGFGAQATSAIPVLRQLLKDGSPDVRANAAEALKQIDPEASPKRGNK